MADAKRDSNRIPTALGVSSVDLTTPTSIAVNPSTGAVLIDGTSLYTTLDSRYINEGQIAAGDLSGTYPNPSVVDDSHNHTYTTITPTIVSTKKAILELSAITYSGRIAYATTESSTDTTRVDRFYVADGTNWKESIKLHTRTSSDMGMNPTNDLAGYEDDTITDKTLYNIAIGGSSRTENGELRVNADEDPDTFEIYLRDQWNTIIYDLTTEYGDFRHTPLDEQIYVWSGNSVNTGLNDLPIVQAYQVSMGAYPYPVQLTGGSF